ncbi:RDD family protein [Streptomyces sp. JJ66]|uniref:RDD family protein n=1 Tax=Streptomyces sp. JJ66 TaxID=2803843 RepID=UPI001C567FD5|nr:RDD family protein [Streptomyces sp. JJ66]MBW1603187.1 RDD family protein [Streptomyces sp. JJ66]
MSAPPSASANGSTPAGYYPDPSIPGYIRYWDGSAWVPGTSRPEPHGGEPSPQPPPGVPAPAGADAAPAPAAVPEQREAGRAPREETGPVFLDEEPPPASPAVRSGPGREPASAWQADAERQAGFGGERDQRVDWGAAPDAQPASAQPASAGPASADPRWAADPRGGWQRAGAGGVEPSRAKPPAEPTSASRPGARSGDGEPDAARPAPQPRPARGDDTFTLRAVRPGTLPPGPGEARAAAPAVPQSPQPSQPSQPSQQKATPQPGGWARQVQELAQPRPSGTPSGASALSGPSGPSAPVDEQVPLTPWRPPADDPFLRAAQAQARPAGLGRRFAARLIDSLVQGGVAAAVAVPLVPRAVDHVRAKVDAVEQAGVTRDVWLLDGTTCGYLALVLGVFLGFGVLYEALPTARWGRTLGKKLCGVRVLRVEEQTPPGFGGALVRWLLYGVLASVLVGVVNAAWCLFDRPWRQCWHDKAARTFVAAREESSVRLG